MSLADPIASGRLEIKIATSSATLTLLPVARPMPRTACSGMPSRREPSASGSSADPPPGPTADVADGPGRGEKGDGPDRETDGH